MPVFLYRTLLSYMGTTNEPMFACFSLSLRQLLSGVASLHVYAEQFENIDKIADVNPTRDRVV